MSKHFKLAGLITGIAALDIAVLSPDLLGMSLGGSPLQAAVGASTSLASIMALVYGVHALYFKPEEKEVVETVNIHDQYYQALQNQHSHVLRNDISFALEQMNRMKKKQETLQQVLQERFQPTELTYQKFMGVVEEVQQFFYANVKNLLNKLRTFDEAEYKSVIDRNTTRFSPKILEEKQELYNEYMTAMKKAIDINEEILMDIDKLLIEISRLDEVTINDVDELPCIQDINALIQQTKKYKH